MKTHAKASGGETEPVSIERHVSNLPCEAGAASTAAARRPCVWIAWLPSCGDHMAVALPGVKRCVCVIEYTQACAVGVHARPHACLQLGAPRWEGRRAAAARTASPVPESRSVGRLGLPAPGGPVPGARGPAPRLHGGWLVVHRSPHQLSR